MKKSGGDNRTGKKSRSGAGMGLEMWGNSGCGREGYFFSYQKNRTSSLAAGIKPVLSLFRSQCAIKGVMVLAK